MLEKKRIQKAITFMVAAMLLVSCVGCSIVGKQPSSGEETADSTVEVTQPADVHNNLANEIEDHTTIFASGDQLYCPPMEKLTFDQEAGEIFFNNTIRVYSIKPLDSAEQNKLAASVGGIVSGEISGLNAFQITVPDTDLDTLNKDIETLSLSEDVLYATYLYPAATSISGTYDPTNTPWVGQADLNADTPGGNDWWAEAIGAYDAWDVIGELSPVIVGVIDTGFDTAHEDLQRGHTPVVNMLNSNTIDDHGTHVAGLIAAQDNGIGIRGVADNAIVLGVDWSDSLSDRENTSFTVEDFIEFTQDLLRYSDEHGAPIVINNSWGISIPTKDRYTQIVYEEENKDGVGDLKYIYEYFLIHATGAYDSLLDYLEIHAKRTAAESLLMIVECLLRGKDDFIIVQSAGNGYDGKAEGLDSRRSGWYCGIDEELYNTIFSQQVRDRLASSGITYSSVKDHIMIVGAVDLPRADGTYPLTKFSSFGETVDICAPGQAIYSTIPADANGFRYAKADGTSMAGPIAAGSAALVWSHKPSMTAAQVKTSLSNASEAVGVTGKDAGTHYPMLDVGNAVRSILYDNLVTDAYSAEASYNDFGGKPTTAEFHIPEINLDGSEIKQINQSIYDEWYDDVRYSLESIEKYGSPALGYLKYSWSISGDILCLHLQTEWPMDDGFEGHEIYNVMMSSRREATTQDVLSACGFDRERYDTLVEQALASAFLEFAHQYLGGVPDEYSKQCYQNTISAENIADTKPFIGEDGHLYILGHYYIPAGGGSSLCITDLDTFTPSQYYGEDFGASSEARTTDKYQDLPAAYANFLSGNQFVDDDYSGKDMNEYCVIDLDGDGIDEVILAGQMFGTEYMIYVYEQQSSRFVLAGVGNAMSDIEYSPSNHAIVTWWRDMNNGNVLYMYTIATLNGSAIEYEPGFTYESGKDRYVDNRTGQALSRASCEKYLSDLETIEFLPMETN